jgi:Lon protease-like protein
MERCKQVPGLYQIPLFPLNTVLFPGMVLPLHVFEPRYRVMINRCIQTGQPFGVVFIHEGDEVGGSETHHNIGTSALITQVDRLADGRMNIQTVGFERFRIKGYYQEQPYKIALAEEYPTAAPDNTEAAQVVGQIYPAFTRYLNSLIRHTDMTLSGQDIPQEPLALAYFIAIVMPLPLEDKQRILASPTAIDMLQLESSFIRRELALLAALLQPSSGAQQAEIPFSSN